MSANSSAGDRATRRSRDISAIAATKRNEGTDEHRDEDNDKDGESETPSQLPEKTDMCDAEQITDPAAEHPS
jgi:hypothetical protein